jgi:glycerophosphoryl diester phosphodiesterase
MNLLLAPETRIAHRGASAFYPENTLEAFEGAHRLGARWVETDVMLTQDGVPVLFHDETLERMTGDPQPIADINYEDLRRVDVGSWFDPKFKGACIPSLAQGLACFQQLSLALNLELKPTPGKEEATAMAAVDQLKQSAFPPSHLIISSFTLSALEAAHRVAPQYAYGWLADTPEDLERGLQSSLPWTSLHINNAWATAEVIRSLRDRNFLVLVFTVNDPVRARWLFDQGVVAVFADDPGMP